MQSDELDVEFEIDEFTGKRGRPGKRLFQYALFYKKPIVLALLMLLIAVSTELVGPFIAKRILDVHISGIEQPWVRMQSAQPATVSFQDALWIRQDNLAASPEFVQRAATRERARVLQVGRSFYFVPGGITTDGVRQVSDEGRDTQLTITSGASTRTYAAVRLTSEELYAFYRPEISGMLRLAWIFVALMIISAGFSWGQRYFLQVSANRIIRKMRDDVFAQINRLPITYFDHLPAGKVVSRITNDTEAIKDLYVSVLANFFSGTLYIFAILVAMFLLDAKLALICALVVPLLGVWIVIYRKYAAHYNRVIRSTLSEMNGMLNEAIQGMPIIQAFRRERATEREFEDLNERYFVFRKKLQHLDSLTSWNLIGFIRNVAFVALIWYFGGIALNTPEGAISIGVLYAFVDYLNRMFQPVVNIVNQLARLEQALVSAERVFALLDEPGEPVSPAAMPRYRGNVVFEDVWFSYKPGQPVLKGITFEAKQGQTIALVGHTGSGKSSILNVLFRFYDVDSGRITVDGVDISHIPRQSLRSHMGIVLQDPILFTGTITSNITLGDASISPQLAKQALLDVGGERLLASLPQGMHEPVIEKGSTLSAGQRQLISFARALAFDPAILILDEATSNIDTETEAVIQQALDVVKQGRTTFVIAHRLSTIRHADLILVMHHGEIAERGTHDELIAHEGKYAQMYKLQQGSFAQEGLFSL